MKGTSKGIVRVLVADDEPTIRRLIEETLQKQKLFVKACGDGAEVLRALQKAAFSALVLDWMMPGLTGLEVVRTLRRQDEAVPVILMTELDLDLAQKIVEDLALVTILRKPFGVDELVTAVKRVTGRIRA